MIGRTNASAGGSGGGGGGGSLELDINVVGGTSQPSSPENNTIWVNTSETITSYVISYTEPSSPESGMVWIEISNDTDNILFITEDINFGIGFVRQYISGAWVFLQGKVYQNSTWTPIQTWLYYHGTYNTTLGGTWARNNTNGTFLDEDDFFEKVNGSSNYYTGTTVDLTNVDSVIFDLTVLRAGTYNFGYISVSTKNGSYANTWTSGAVKTKLGSAAARQKYTLNVSSLSGSYYVIVGANSSSGTSRVRTFSIELR